MSKNDLSFEKRREHSNERHYSIKINQAVTLPAHVDYERFTDKLTDIYLAYVESHGGESGGGIEMYETDDYGNRLSHKLCAACGRFGDFERPFGSLGVVLCRGCRNSIRASTEA